MKIEFTPKVDAKFAWREVPKAEAPKRSATERVSDFFEIYSFLDEETARQQALRCIQCPEPLCVQGCPVNNFIPAWMALTAEGRFLEAAKVLQTSSCMEDIFSRLCSHPCEPRCILEGRGEPVAINAVERFLNDYAVAHGAVQVVLPPASGFKVAVMNSGPCGLTCAYDLARRGHAVTVFDSRPFVGGLLVHGIPAFKMEKAVLQRRLAVMRQLGVQFKLGMKPGVSPTLQELRASFDAVFFGAAIGRVKPLDVPGANLPGVHQGLTYLVQQNGSVPLDAVPIEVKDKRVVVLGGGDVAMDCARIALRGGAKDVLCLYRRDEANLRANRYEYENAREEGARFEFLASPVALLGNGGNHVTTVRCVRTQLGEPDAEGRPEPLPVPETEFAVSADVVLVALGFVSAPFEAEGDLKELAVTPDGRLLVNENLMTNIPGVFAGGTLVRGASAFLDAVHDARKAAASIQKFIGADKAKPVSA